MTGSGFGAVDKVSKSGDTLSGTLTSIAAIPFNIPAATDQQTLVSDASDNFIPDVVGMNCINAKTARYGAKGDTKVVLDGAMSSSTSTTTLTSATAGFVSTDVGKTVSVAGAGAAGAILAGTISTYISATQVTLSVACATTVSGAKTTWGTDDTAAIQAAMNAAGPLGNTVYLPSGNYTVSSTLLWKPPTGGLTNQSFNAPSLKGAGCAASYPRFLNTVTGATTLTASGTFTVGEFMIDYIGDTGANNCISGYEISALHLDCRARAAGMRNCNAHSSTHRHLTINQPATPAPANNVGGPTAGLSAVASPSTNAWNNRYENIIVFGAAQDGFQFNEGNGSWVMAVNCLAGNAGRYGFQAGDASCLIACSSQAAVTADFLVYRSTLIGCNNEPWIGGCRANALLFTGNNSRQAQIIGGEYGGNSNAGVTGTNAALISFGSGGQVFDVVITGVSFVTEAHTSYWLNVPGSSTTGKIAIKDCNFSTAGGALGTAPWVITPVIGPSMQISLSGNLGLNPLGVQVIAVPATTVATAALPYDATFYVTAGSSSCTVAISSGPTITVPANACVPVFVPASQTLTPTYTVAPTWVVMGQ